MATLADLQAAIDAVNTHISSETSEISAMIKALQDQVAGGISPGDADGIVTQLNEIANKVDAISGPPANP